MMNKDEIIRRYGEAEYETRLERSRAWNKAHRERTREIDRKWKKANRGKIKVSDKKRREAHPEKVKAYNREMSCKGGKHYERTLKYKRTGVQGERHKIRGKHGDKWRPFKAIIAPDSQLHHEWIPDTSEYRGVALVEANAHMHGFVDVIQILDGEITLLTEEEVRKGVKREK